jgi:hypothetical protein
VIAFKDKHVYVHRLGSLCCGLERHYSDRLATFVSRMGSSKNSLVVNDWSMESFLFGRLPHLLMPGARQNVRHPVALVCLS